MLHIGVTGTGSLVGQAIIKCINASEYFKESTIIGLDYIDNTVGSYWVDKNVKLPDILDRKNNSYERVAAAVIDTILKEGIKILFIGIDFDLPMYAQHKDHIEKSTGAIVVVSSPEVVAIADDKYKTFSFLKDNGFCHPETYKVQERPKRLNFPMILKPAVGASSRGVSIVESEEQIEERAMLLKDPILQELVGDAFTEYTCGVIMLDHQFIDSIVLRRELKNGDTFKAWHSFSFPEKIYTYIRKVTEALDPFGACNYQLRLDKEGIPKLFEINARHSGSTYFRQLFGYNEIEIILNHYFPVYGYSKPALKEGTAIRYFEEKLILNNKS